MIVIVAQPVMLPSAKDAIEKLQYFDACSEKGGTFYQYELNVVFNNERQPIGYQVRVKDIDGFGLGYLA